MTQKNDDTEGICDGSAGTPIEPPEKHAVSRDTDDGATQKRTLPWSRFESEAGEAEFWDDIDEPLDYFDLESARVHFPNAELERVPDGGFQERGFDDVEPVGNEMGNSDPAPAKK